MIVRRAAALCLLAAMSAGCGDGDEAVDPIAALERDIAAAEREVRAIAEASACDDVAQCRAVFVSDRAEPCEPRPVAYSTTVDEPRLRAALREHNERVRAYHEATREPATCLAVLPPPPPPPPVLACRGRRCMAVGDRRAAFDAPQRALLD